MRTEYVVVLLTTRLDKEKGRIRREEGSTSRTVQDEAESGLAVGRPLERMGASVCAFLALYIAE